MDQAELEDVSEALPTLTEGEEGDEHTDDDDDSLIDVPPQQRRKPAPFASPGRTASSSSFGSRISTDRRNTTTTRAAEMALQEFSKPMPLLDDASSHSLGSFTEPPSFQTQTSSSPSSFNLTTTPSRRKSTIEPIKEDALYEFASPISQTQKFNNTNSKQSPHKRSMSGDLDTISPYTPRQKTPGVVRRSMSLDADPRNKLIVPDSPADRLSSIILPGSLGAKVSRRSAHFKSSIAQVSTNFFNRAQGMDDEMQYVGDINHREELYPSETVFRGYSVGDSVLVFTNHRFVSSVNRFGFPPGQGRTAEEKNGPYLFVLGKIEEIHFEENSVFYTVRREDTGVDVRGNPAYMEPITSKEGEAAAKKAAFDFAFGEPFETHSSEVATPVERRNKKGCLKVLETIFVFLLLPVFWIYDCFIFVAGARLYRWGSACLTAVRNQSFLFLNGMKPYDCSTRVTMINVVVLCSFWYIFIDQIRLAFVPAEYDNMLATINFAIWIILFLELILEVFIRPDGYHDMMESDKAFTPTTVRFISGIHLVVEFVSLIFFIPEFLCLFSSDITCDGRPAFSFLHSSMLTVTGPTRLHSFAGRCFHACIRLRVFGLVRHWKNYWVNHNFLKRRQGVGRHAYQSLPERGNTDMSWSPDVGAGFSVDERTGAHSRQMKQHQKEGVSSLINASNIGTALMVTNSYRSLTILCIIMGIFPMISLIAFHGVTNPVGADMTLQLQGLNLLTGNNATAATCDLLENAVRAWMKSWSYMDHSLITSDTDNFLLGLVISPSRCADNLAAVPLDDYTYQEVNCEKFEGSEYAIDVAGTCSHFHLNKPFWEHDVRVGNMQQQHFSDDGGDDVYSVTALFNQTRAIENSAFCSFLLQVCLVLTAIGSLMVLRRDAKSFVLGPLRSMLKIVARYAKNPLAQTTPMGRDFSVVSDSSESEADDDEDDDSQGNEVQTDETEQLIRAVAKITDLLRKCWGVAGADIISTNLASRETALAEVFNPTVPGKSVYALFGFVAINGFDHCLRCLGGDVMILINDVAAVLHREVYRWGFEDSGQCNKNLGEAFLMVFRIGLVKEVLEKLEEATKVVFSTSDAKRLTVKKRNSGRRDGSFEGIQRLRRMSKIQKLKTHDAMAEAMQLSLQSLPGISTFTDRAVIGMLKSFAGIHRDKKLMTYSRDFRLSAGVGAFSVNMVFGMDAGWAVEGAVGSEYKIDATYLSPHVNMASRMMSACKHYGVTILLSEAVQELMSDIAKSKLRNVDRVTVKGSTWVQKIYTYDARHKGADFFLFNRSDDAADMDAERYVANIWNTDQDLKAMRHHITEDFISEFNAGMKSYLHGDWPEAIAKLEKANEIIVDAALEEGYLHDEMDESPDRLEIKRECSDGPTVYLINFMKSQGGVAPPNWNGWHPLLSK